VCYCYDRALVRLFDEGRGSTVLTTDIMNINIHVYGFDTIPAGQADGQTSGCSRYHAQYMRINW